MAAKWTEEHEARLLDVLADYRPHTVPDVVDAMGLPHGGPGQGGRGTGKVHGAHVLTALKRLLRRDIVRNDGYRGRLLTWQLVAAPKAPRNTSIAKHGNHFALDTEQDAAPDDDKESVSDRLERDRAAEDAAIQFEVGRSYRRAADIHARYGGQAQGGISTPAGYPAVLLFTGKSGWQHGYDDGWTEDGVFLFVGEGQRGDMQFKGGNRAIRDHARDGKALYLFEAQGKGTVVYIGEFVCSTYEHSTGPDTDGKPRATIVFHLVPESNLEGRLPGDDAPPALDLAELRQRAIDAASPAARASQAIAKKTVYERSRAVRDYVLARARGICESCGHVAPFVRKDGSPYLEPHHTRRVSDGGPDDPRWVAAVCPNCHAEIHRGQNGGERNAALEAKIGEVETSQRGQIACRRPVL